MRDRDFQAKILGVEEPWTVTDVVVTMKPKTVDFEGPAACPECGLACPKYDARERRWRHLDIYEFKAFVVGRVPRVECAEHGVRQIGVPWAEGRSGFTALFERLAISLLQEMSISAVARTLSLSWDEIDGIMQRAINRGLALRAQRLVRNIGIDEKSFKKRHKYVTIVTDLDRSEVLWVGSGRKRETIDRFWTSLSSAQLRAIDGVAMDMWPAYIESTLAHLPGAGAKIVFDKCHVVKHLTHAVDLERRRESGRNPGLKRTRFAWIRNPKNMTESERDALAQLRRDHKRVGRA